MRSVAASNPLVSHLRRLSGRRRARLDAGEFVLEGPNVVAEALAAGAALTTVVVDAEALVGSPELAGLADAAASRGIDVVALPAGVLARANDAATPQGIAAIAPRPGATLGELTARPGLVVLLDAVADPGNVGTIVRTALGAGALGVVVGEGSADPFGPKAVRAAAGALFHLPVVESHVVEAVASLRAAGWRAVGADTTATLDHTDADLTGAVALVLGNEARGISPEVRAGLDQSVRIPLAGGLESLNVGVAAAVLCFETARQRSARGAR